MSDDKDKLARNDAVSSANLIDIPSELLVNIFLYVQALDLVSLCKACSRFRSIILNDDLLWHNFCYKDYGKYITNIQGWNNLTYRDLYTLVLYKFGSILGLRKMDIQHYGGLVHIHVTNGRIIAEQCCAPIRDQLTSPLRMKPIFEITCDNTGVITALCLVQSHPRHGQQSLKINDVSKEEVNQFSFACHTNDSEPESGSDISDGEDEEEENSRHLRDDFQRWIQEEYRDEYYLSSNPHLVYGVIGKYKTIKEAFQNAITFTRLALSSYSANDGCVITPGIYKGTYSSHGIELIQVTDCREKVLGTKITGDPNIPAGQWTFDVDLTDRIPEEESAVCYRLELPEDVVFREVANPATHYTARYKGFGQIASEGYKSPMKSPIVMYVISDTEMGILWVDLRCLAMFTRTTEAFLQ